MLTLSTFVSSLASHSNWTSSFAHFKKLSILAPERRAWNIVVVSLFDLGQELLWLFLFTKSIKALDEAGKSKRVEWVTSASIEWELKEFDWKCCLRWCNVSGICDLLLFPLVLLSMLDFDLIQINIWFENKTNFLSGVLDSKLYANRG